MTYEAISLPVLKIVANFLQFQTETPGCWVMLCKGCMKTAFLYPSQSGDHAHYTVPSCDVWALRVGVEERFFREFLAYLESILRI